MSGWVYLGETEDGGRLWFAPAGTPPLSVTAPEPDHGPEPEGGTL